MPKIRDASAVEVRARTSYGDITIRRSLPASGAGKKKALEKKSNHDDQPVPAGDSP
jgi:hypothetical protein